ncbi:mitochondrial import inner membrane translocase subunit Tim29 [Pezoporus flaviventris]|uniref:mitochondrial import inner membrane translocase subunit Tim29 n=1 Tax=Pezoporus flaviventris TaxID=889875 RepID=UPI002AB051CA|nr:mitochondrial import inner membrane translocase subunit Tim29 [Pezoporus flaviventris]
MAAAAVGAGRGLWAWMARTRLGRWCQALVQDYATALRETAQSARQRPLALAVTAAALSGAAACGSSVPSAESFEAAVVEAAGSLLVLSPGTRSPGAERHVQRLLRRREAGRLRYRHLVLLAVVYEAPCSASAQLYASRCRYLQPLWRQAPARLLDVGFCGRWWLLRHRLRDYDVNEDEFRALPPHLRCLEPRQLRSEHTERLFLQKYEPAVLGDGIAGEEEEA